MMHGQRNIK